jgi:uncharacterized protein YkwD
MQCMLVLTLMRHIVVLALLGGVICATPAAAPAQPSPTAKAPAVEPVLATLIQLHNQHRGQAGLPPLTMHTRLMQAAQIQAQYMAEHTNTTHEGPDGTTPAQRVKQQGYDYVQVAENVAGGPETPEVVLQGWMHSPPHRQNILGPFSDIGAARAAGADGRQYWCVVFGTPLPRLDPHQAAATVVRLLNQQRSAASLPPLQVASTLAEAAQAQAQAIAKRTAVQHQQSTEHLQQQLQQAGYAYRKISQGTVSGAPTPQAVVQAFMTHSTYKNQVLGDFTQVGVGYATAADGMPCWSILFGAPQG